MNLLTDVNGKIVKNEREITVEKQEFSTQKGFVCIYEKKGVSIDFSQSQIDVGESFLDIQNSQDVTIKNLAVSSKSFPCVKVRASKNVNFINCTFSAQSVCVMLDGAQATFSGCDFIGGNGVCVVGESDVKIKTCNFTQNIGEGVTVVDNGLGKVEVIECAFKKCLVALKSAGRNDVRFANNYCSTKSHAIEILPSLFKDKFGAHHFVMEYNMIDEVGDVAVFIDSAKGMKAHSVVEIRENIFLFTTAPVINASGVESLAFKNNNVKTEKESEVTNSVINGIVC